MRSAGGTNCAPPCVVVACTNSTIARLAAPSFHDGRGSVADRAAVLPARATKTITASRFIVSLLCNRGSGSVARRPKRFQLVEPLHRLHRLDRVVVDAGGVQAAALLERILRQR